MAAYCFKVALLLGMAHCSRVKTSRVHSEAQILKFDTSLDKVSDQCPTDFDPLDRRDCNGFLQTPAFKHGTENDRAEACASEGCCWQPLRNTPWCYKKADSSGQCSTSQDPSTRANCAAFGGWKSEHWDEKVRGEGCEEAGCCWQPLKTVPWCFPKTDSAAANTCKCPSQMAPKMRTDCAIFQRKNESRHSDDSIRESACLSVGCCWQPLDHGSKEPWCFVNPDCSSDGNCDAEQDYGFDDKGTCRVVAYTKGAWVEFGGVADTVCCRQAAAKTVVTKVTKADAQKEEALEANTKASEEANKADMTEAPCADAKRRAQEERQIAMEAADAAAKEAADAAAKEAADAAAKEAARSAKAEQEAAVRAEREREEARLRAAEAAARAKKKEEDAAAAERAEAAAKAAGKAAAEVVVKEHDNDAPEVVEECAKAAAAKKAEVGRLEEEQKHADEIDTQSRTLPGTLTVKVVEANSLPMSDPFWTFGVKPDAFATVTVGSTKKATRRINGNGNPRWNWQAEFPVSVSDSVVTIDIFDYDLLGDDRILWGLLDKHDYLGGVKVNFRNLAANEATPFSTAIPDTKSTSTVEYILTWTPQA